MPRQLALLLCLAFIGWLFRRERKAETGDLAFSWVPAVWFACITSKPLSYWLGIGGGTSRLEGNPVEAAFQLAIFIAAFVVLVKRRVDWAGFFSRNTIFVIFFGYFVLSVLWSPYPIPSAKRITKELGQVLVLLVVLTEADPSAALRTMFRRCAFYLLPLSILLIKYYGDMGRAYTSYAGEVMYVGVAGQKNSLGALAALCSLGLIWEIVARRWDQVRRSSWWGMRHLIITLLMALYLLRVSNSKTSLLCFIIVLALFSAGRLRAVRENPRRFLIGFFTVVPSLFIAEALFRVSDLVLAMLGRDRSLTNRTNIWDAVLAVDTDPILGWGFYSFWDSPTGRRVTDGIGASISHNGYIEVFLDGGGVGVLLLLLILLTGLIRTCRNVIARDPDGIMKFALVVMAIVYNWSESSYLRLSSTWFCFLFSSLQGPAEPKDTAQISARWEPQAEETDAEVDAELQDAQPRGRVCA